MKVKLWGGERTGGCRLYQRNDKGTARPCAGSATYTD